MTKIFKKKCMFVFEDYTEEIHGFGAECYTQGGNVTNLQVLVVSWDSLKQINK